MSVTEGPDGTPRYLIFHGPSDQRLYEEQQLAASGITPEAISTDPREQLAVGPTVSPSDLRAHITAARMAHPLSDNIYSMKAARIAHVPFQFKPLLRLLRSDQQRLLIADEVGVGKTIEAGLIMKELDARETLRNVLILCPKALVQKWRAEMRRFDESFRILDGGALDFCIREAHLEGAWPSEYARAIAPLELMRRDQHLLGRRDDPRPALTTLEPPPWFDLLIVDEAHHLRNPQTSAHQLAEHLCQTSGAAIFLSATPLQTSDENLFSLLNLLRPDLFPDLTTFRLALEPNRPLLSAMRAIRQRDPADGWARSAADRLDDVSSTDWGQRALATDPRLRHWRHELSGGELDDEDRVTCLRDLEELHSLAHVMNRTRRRDIGAFTIREPVTVAVPFTERQSEIYEALRAFRIAMLNREHDPLVVRLIMNTFERQATSCLPAAARSLRRLVERSEVVDGSDLDEFDGARIRVTDEIGTEAAHIIARLSELDLDEDAKLRQLQMIVRDTLAGDGPGKILLFSFFLDTIDYLAAALDGTGVRVGVITGRVHDAEREQLQGRFRLPREHPRAIDLLISSEVGCEGLDYEFCDRLVNYDIPWNPMRLEQRIGRIDRFGQSSPKVLIYNFVVPGTVEERVFHRCYERLDLFRTTVGDLESVLGSLVGELDHLARDPSLTPEQVELRAQQLADNFIADAQERARLEAESAGLLGLDVPLEERAEEADQAGHYIGSGDLEHLVRRFVEAPSIGAQLSAPRSGIATLRMNRAGRVALASLCGGLALGGGKAERFEELLRAGDSSIELAFDQEVALARREVQFITPLHPLARAAMEEWRPATGEPLVARLRSQVDGAGSGSFLFALDLWEEVGIRKHVRLVATVVSAGEGMRAEHLENRLLEVLRRSEAAPDRAIRALPGSIEALEIEAAARRRQEVDGLQMQNDALLERRHASLSGHYDRLIRKVADELDRASDSRIVRMRSSQLRRLAGQRDAKLAEIEDARIVDIVSTRLAIGELEAVPRGN